jgi:aminoglycoside phosphotransferase (APT) family kinase protein
VSIDDTLQSIVRAHINGATDIRGLRQLSAGASMETWSFDAVSGAGIRPLILRRRPPGNARADDIATLATEAATIQAAVAAGVRAPIVCYVLTEQDGLGGGFLMERIEGETIGRRIQRALTTEVSRDALIQHIGVTAALIHRVPLASLPALDTLTIEATLDDWHRQHTQQQQYRPVFELALRYLHDHIPPGEFTPRLVHGDYRLGNLIVGDDGLRAVLDWELCHIGDPMFDLAWLCVPPWRFGQLERPVAGIGAYEELFAAYESTGERVDRDRVRYWELFGSLRWGLMCSGMLDWFRSGSDTSVERAMIARRASESELDLLRALSELR